MNSEDYLKKHGDKVLCYIEGHFAYFTSNLSKQWGDDWNDMPYEHNAGEPYQSDEISVEKLAFLTHLTTPAETAGVNSKYSVESINKGEIPWLIGKPNLSLRELERKSGILSEDLFSTRYTSSQVSKIIREVSEENIEIYAGTSMNKFIEIVNENDGEVYLRL